MRNTIRNVSIVAGAAMLLQTSTALAQIAAGKTNNFEDGTTQGWLINLLGQGTVPAGGAPTNIPTGGPAGANDNYLRLTSNGSDEGGGRLIALNPTWGGNYLTAGISGIRMDVINLGTTDLALRFFLEDATNGPPQNVAMSSLPVKLRPGSGWQSIFFPLFGTGGMAAFQGNVNTALANATFARILNAPSFDYPADPIVAQLGIDNITAVAIVAPEPASLLLFGIGATGLLVAARRRSVR